jgi:hypothetical protein
VLGRGLGVGAGREVVGSCLGGSGDTGRRRLVICEHRREDRENEPTRARGRRLNSLIPDGPLGDRRT